MINMDFWMSRFRYNQIRDVPTAFTFVGFYFVGIVVKTNLADIAYPYLDSATLPLGRIVKSVVRNNTLGADNGSVVLEETMSFIIEREVVSV